MNLIRDWMLAHFTAVPEHASQTAKADEPIEGSGAQQAAEGQPESQQSAEAQEEGPELTTSSRPEKEDTSTDT